LPNKKSAKKRVKQNARSEAWNRAAKSTMKSSIKRSHELLAAGETGAEKQVRDTQALIGRLNKRGVIHKNKAARLQSRLMVKASKPAAEKS
jgi:small subunit ribosomal protein S20